MITTGNLKLTFSALCLVALSAFHAYAAPTLTVVGEGTTYSVVGSGLDGIAGIDLTLSYDSSSLISPSVSQGGLISGSMMVPNTNIPGSIRIAVISTKPFSGSGQIVSISFASQKGSGGITSLAYSLVDSSGKSIAGQGTVAGGGATPSSTPGLPFSDPVPASSGTSTGTGTSTAGTGTSTGTTTITPPPQIFPPVYLGTPDKPAETQPKIDAKPEEPPVTQPQPAEAPAAAAVEPPVEEKRVAEPAKPREAKMVAPRGTLENFRTYQGEKSPAIFTALMTRDVTPNIQQQPVVALSDGTTTVKILVKLAPGVGESPNFALNGARLVDLGKDDAAGSWIIEALPQANVLQATLTILAGNDIIEFPLTLAPPVAGITPAEADFAAFLKDSGAVPPKRDLNADGRHDYLDDFIYTANYLKLKGAAGSPTTR